MDVGRSPAEAGPIPPEAARSVVAREAHDKAAASGSASTGQPLFEAGRLSWHGKYLKPAKILLVDLAVIQSGLDKAIAFAKASPS